MTDPHFQRFEAAKKLSRIFQINLSPKSPKIIQTSPWVHPGSIFFYLDLNSQGDPTYNVCSGPVEIHFVIAEDTNDRCSAIPKGLCLWLD